VRSNKLLLEDSKSVIEFQLVHIKSSSNSFSMSSQDTKVLIGSKIAACNKAITEYDFMAELTALSPALREDVMKRAQYTYILGVGPQKSILEGCIGTLSTVIPSHELSAVLVGYRNPFSVRIWPATEFSASELVEVCSSADSRVRLVKPMRKILELLAESNDISIESKGYLVLTSATTGEDKRKIPEQNLTKIMQNIIPQLWLEERFQNIALSKHTLYARQDESDTPAKPVEVELANVLVDVGFTLLMSKPTESTSNTHVMLRDSCLHYEEMSDGVLYSFTALSIASYAARVAHLTPCGSLTFNADGSATYTSFTSKEE
jgi:hypothetical protein